MIEVAEKLTNETCVSLSEMAAALDITGRRINQLVQDGVLSCNGKSQYPLFENIHRYLDYKAKEREETKSKDELDRIKSEVAIKKAKATVATMEAQELLGKMHRSEDVQAMTEDLLYAVRNALLALPGRLAVETAAASEPKETSVMIRDEVYQIMAELSNYSYDPEKYAERVRDRRNWDTTGADDDG